MGVVKRKASGRQIKKILILMIEANLLFCIWDLIFALLSGTGISDFFQENLTKQSVLKFVLFNESPFNAHLWYLGAILYVLIIFSIADKLNIRKLLFAITPLLLVGDLVFGKYSLALFGREFNYILVRNFLFVGIPYFSIGCLLKLYENKIKNSLKDRALLGAAIIFSVTTILERYILVSSNMNAVRDHYISTTFLAGVVFMLAMKGFGLFGGNSKIGALLMNIGKNYSTWIYIIHPIFIKSINIIVTRMGLYSIYKYVAPIMVYIVTVLFVAFIDKGKKYIAVRIHKS